MSKMLSANNGQDDPPPNGLTYEQQAKANGMRYTINDVPPLPTALLLGLQQCMIMLVGTVIVPLIYGFAMGGNPSQVGQMASTILLVSGLNTLLQTTFGDRLPIVQGGSFAFLPATFSIIFHPELISIPDQEERFLQTMRVLQGSIFVAGCIQIGLGYSGVVVPLLRFVGPVTIAPVIAVIGLGLYYIGFTDVATCFPMGLTQIGLTILFAQYLKQVKICGMQFFSLFPIALAIGITWSVFGILTASDVFEEGSLCRTDTSQQAIADAPWFRIPYPWQWGPLMFRSYGIIPMMGAMLASMIESIGDYYSCARLSGAPPPTPGIISRGLGNEGIGVVLCGLFGTGNGTTSYSQNIAALSLTGCGSRAVIQIAGVMMIIISVFAKATQALAGMPSAMTGGIYCTVFGLIITVGLANLQFIDLNSERNLFIIGFALYNSLSIAGPAGWFASLEGVNPFGSTNLAAVALSIFDSPMIVALLSSFLLDNTIPGTREERGLSIWDKVQTSVDINNEPEYVATYSLPGFLSKLFRNCGYLEFPSRGKFPDPPRNGYQPGRGGMWELCFPYRSTDTTTNGDGQIPKRENSIDEEVAVDVPTAEESHEVSA